MHTLRIDNVRILTMDDARSIIDPGFIAVDQDRIIALGQMASAGNHPASAVVDGGGKVALPGFVNAHTHAIHNLLRGGPSDDRRLYDWLLNVLYPGVNAYTAADAKVAAELFVYESVTAGITTFVDNADLGQVDFLADETISVYRDRGVRAIYARMFSDYTPPHLEDYITAIEQREPSLERPDVVESADEALASIEALINRHHGTGDGRIQVWPSPGIAVFTSREGLLGAQELGRRTGTRVTIHVAESTFDRMQHGMSSIEYLSSIGFLDDRTLCGHCVHLDANDIRVLKRSGASVANNVVSNMFLASGIAPVAEMLLAGIPVGLGTDDCNCNTSVNMLADMKVAALAQKVRYLDSSAITAYEVLEMATIRGARAVGMADDIGSLEVGKKADIVLVDCSAPHMTPHHDTASVLVYQANGSEIDSVYVDGVPLMTGRRVAWLDDEGERELARSAQRVSSGVISRAGLRPSGS
jgi:atrazine chlorohydrolase/5-methylthioadenosine/S-adenosylhomocysteine deaminase/melamine deaminase